MSKKKKKVPAVVDDPATPEVDESMEEVADDGEVEFVENTTEVEPDVEAAEAADDAAQKRALANEMRLAAAQAESEAVAAESKVQTGEDMSPLDPEKVIAIDTGGMGTYEIQPIPAGYRPFARVVTILGRSYEHVAEHRGVWAYRHLG